MADVTLIGYLETTGLETGPEIDEDYAFSLLCRERSMNLWGSINAIYHFKGLQTCAGCRGDRDDDDYDSDDEETEARPCTCIYKERMDLSERTRCTLARLMVRAEYIPNWYDLTTTDLQWDDYICNLFGITDETRRTSHLERTLYNARAYNVLRILSGMTGPAYTS